MTPTTICLVCGKVITQGEGNDGAPVSHGVCEADYPAYRASMGLKPKPYPGSLVIA